MIQHPLDITVFRFRLTTLASVAAGSELSFAFTGNERNELLALAFTFTTDANVANRTINLFWTRGGSSILIAQTNVAHPANTAVEYSFAPNWDNSGGILGGRLHFPLAWPPLFSKGDAITTVTTNIQVGDQYTLIKAPTKLWQNPVN